jgi:hypothetical protein
MSQAAVQMLDEVLARLKAENYKFYFEEASAEKKTALENNHARLIAQLEKLKSYAQNLPDGAQTDQFIKQLGEIENKAYPYFVRTDFKTVSDDVLIAARNNFTAALETLNTQAQAQPSAPPIIVTPAAPAKPRSRQEQIQTSNAIFMLREFKKLIETIPGAIAQEGILRLSGSAEIANDKFAAYRKDALMTSSNAGVFNWGDPNKVTPNDVVSTLKRLFKPGDAIPGVIFTDLSDGFEKAAKRKSVRQTP